jgi:hypothetical protein
MSEFSRNEDHPSGVESARVARDRKREARRHDCRLAESDRASELKRFKGLTQKLVQTPKPPADK